MSSIHLVVNAAFCVGFSLLVAPAYRMIKNLIIREKTRTTDCVIHSRRLKDKSMVVLDRVASRITNIDDELSEISNKTEINRREIINDSTNKTEEALYKHLSLIEQSIITNIDLAEQELKLEAITLSYEIIKYLIENNELKNVYQNQTDSLTLKFTQTKN